jgi:hypothetical protein
MTTFLRRLRRLIELLRLARAWRAQVAMPWPLPPDADPMHPEDAAALRSFLASETGSRVCAALRRMEYETALAASQRPQPSGRDYACGYAAGTRNMAAYFLTLSAPPSESADLADADAQGATAVRARYTP